MKKGLLTVLSVILIFALAMLYVMRHVRSMTLDKPVIYLYPETETPVTVTLDLDGTMVSSYPKYKNGWNVTARPDGTLIDAETGREYYCLFWEGKSDGEMEPDLSTGACVAGKDTAAYLETTLEQMGLTDREANEFLIYWLPQMEGNPYNLISFQTESYTDAARLTVKPTPDSVLRVFMAWKPLENAVKVEPQTWESFDRCGFTVVEWGGCRVF